MITKNGGVTKFCEDCQFYVKQGLYGSAFDKCRRFYKNGEAFVRNDNNGFGFVYCDEQRGPLGIINWLKGYCGPSGRNWVQK